MAESDGPRQLRNLGLRMKVLGAHGNLGAAEGLGRGRSLRAQLLGAIRVAAVPAVAATREAARSTLPKAGGLNEYIATEKIRVATRLAGPRVGVRITAKGGWGSNRGNVRHPVFARSGRPRVWVQQAIPSSGWFEETLRREAPKAVVPIRAAMDVVAAEVIRRDGRN